MSKRESTKAKPTPTANEVLQAVKFALHGQRFILHTLCRVIVEKTGCEYAHADKVGCEMLRRGDIVAADPIGLTGYSTFKIREA